MTERKGGDRDASLASRYTRLQLSLEELQDPNYVVRGYGFVGLGKLAFSFLVLQ